MPPVPAPEGIPMAKGILGDIAAAGLMNMLTGPHYYSGGLFGAPGMGGFFGGGPMFGVTASGRGTRKGTKRASRATLAGAISEAETSERPQGTSIGVVVAALWGEHRGYRHGACQQPGQQFSTLRPFESRKPRNVTSWFVSRSSSLKPHPRLSGPFSESRRAD
jgi:hypothetical protein